MSPGNYLGKHCSTENGREGNKVIENQVKEATDGSLGVRKKGGGGCVQCVRWGKKGGVGVAGGWGACVHRSKNVATLCCEVDQVALKVLST